LGMKKVFFVVIFVLLASALYAQRTALRTFDVICHLPWSK